MHPTPVLVEVGLGIGVLAALDHADVGATEGDGAVASGSASARGCRGGRKAAPSEGRAAGSAARARAERILIVVVGCVLPRIQIRIWMDKNAPLQKKGIFLPSTLAEWSKKRQMTPPC